MLLSERLATSAAAGVAALLRTVPGASAIRLSARDIKLTTRGATTPAANSQLVLVDGRSVYLDFFGAVLWDSLTFNAADVERIEVVRGPASATWGANALTRAVHIITCEPRHSVGTEVSVWGGVHDRNAGSLSGGGPGRLFGVNASATREPRDTLAYRVSAGHFHSDGFARPAGRVPVVDDPRVAGRVVGGALIDDVLNPLAGHLKFDARVDHQIHGGRGPLS